MNASSTPGTASGAGHFLTTHWSVVLSAQSGQSAKSREALETLCRTYWFPLYAYLRRLGHTPPDAEDLIQGFFARFIEKEYLHAADREKGRFRAFLLTALQRYRANEWDRQHAKKRGGFAPSVPVDVAAAEARFESGALHTLPPDVCFEGQWAVALLDQTMAVLQQEYVASGRATLFEHLRPYLVGEESALPYAELGRRLNITEPALKMAVHRVRARYRDLLREEIAHTVTSAEEVDAEIRHLFSQF